MAIVDRTKANALISQDVVTDIFDGVIEQSAVMQLGTRAADMTTAQTRIPVVSALPTAYFNNAGAAASDTSFKNVTEMSWSNKYLNAEELAVIVPIPEAVLDDADYDIFGAIRPRLVEAFGAAFDAAVLYGTNKPNTWEPGIVTQANTAGNAVTLGTHTDLYGDLLAEDGVVGLLEQDGYMANGHIAAMSLRGKLRNLRGTDGHPIFSTDGQVQNGTRYFLDGEPIIFPRNGAIDPTKSLDIAGDWTQLIWALRQDMTYKILTEAVIQDPVTKDIVYNLAQQDMVALRCVMRVAWATPNALNRVNQNNATRYPFAVLKPSV